MNEKIKGLLICPESRTITEIELRVDGDRNLLYAMYENIGCETVDVVRGVLSHLPSSPDDDIWLDDEGAINGTKVCFRIKDELQWFFGRGLILGCDMTKGECKSHTLTEEDIKCLKEQIQWGLRG